MKFESKPIDSALKPDLSWAGTEIRHVIACPTCGYDFSHPGNVRNVSGDDAYRASWPGRGDLTVINFNGECGHEWELCFGFHKGQTFTFCRILKDAG
jgi:hypothetical protein